MTDVPAARLVPFGAGLLAAVVPWFDSPEVQRWLGGRQWPVRELRLRTAGRSGEFRGARVLRGHAFVALDAAGAAVAWVGGDVYDRWAVWDPARERVTAVVPGRAMGASYVVDLAR